jgi:hypothetical protein
VGLEAMANTLMALCSGEAGRGDSGNGAGKHASAGQN